MRRASWLLIATTLVACRDRPAPAPVPTAVHDARPADAAPIELEARPLGLPDLPAFAWRKRAGQASFRLARKAENRDDWPTVVTLCEQVLAADATHLEAAWLLAIAYAKVGKLDRVVAPLAQAAAGDFGKWGNASMENPALKPFLATPTGEAWVRRFELDRQRFIAAISRGVLVTAGGDLYAVETDTQRWHRLTRTAGQVIGALAIPGTRQLAYVSRASRSSAKAGGRELGLGLLDFARGRGSRPVGLGSAGPIVVAYSAQAPVGFWVGTQPPRTPTPRAWAWRQMDEDYRLHAQPRATRPTGPWLEVSPTGAVRLHALPASVTADWDEQSLASAIRLGTSNRVVSVPSPGLIDGNTAAWSDDRVHLAFVAQLDDHCTGGAVNTAAFVADATTGGTKELERAADGIALQWLGERTLAIAGDRGVAIRSLDDGVPPVMIAGATGLLVPRERPRCAPPDAADLPASSDEETEAAEPEPAAEGTP